MQRHLAALEALDPYAGARGLALAAATAGLASTRADAAPDAKALLARARARGDFVELHRRFSLLSIHHAHDVPHLVDHAARHRRVRQIARAADLVQAEPDQRCPLVVVAPHRAAGLSDFDGFGMAGHGASQSVAASLSAPCRRACKVETLMLRRAATDR